MRDWAHSRRLGTPAGEADYVVLRQPPASKLANLLRIKSKGANRQPIGREGPLLVGPLGWAVAGRGAAWQTGWLSALRTSSLTGRSQST